ncbi:VTT domain-containing protein [Frankia sp. AgB1.9]|uniref:DedA family protein n=1 Tax=unclassified Frankia TaxID=2632575 RepID=UPI001932D295|nr:MULTISPECIES: VTT domain-containing protein [unclassified Frankia]MBL7492187.1 VTT domain-containing protein [Frankia sp. AgW1.1]MBL7552127.1 VTT domain-containing protein [Frankia sp. AgB1.9]MBL7622154.1 VTT domain-containing protein [Frankia sp. AgB1.8]
MSASLAVNVLDPASLTATFGLTGLILVVFAETGLLIGFFLPGDSLLFLAGAYSATAATGDQPHFQLGAVLAGVAVAAILGAQVGYLIGRRTGPRLFNRPNSRLFKQENVLRAQEFLERYGYGKSIILARFVPIVRTFMNPVAGVVGVPARTFLVYNVIGGLVWSLGVTLLGYALGRAIPIDRYIIPVTLLIVLLSAIPVLREFAKRRGAGGRHSSVGRAGDPEGS